MADTNAKFESAEEHAQGAQAFHDDGTKPLDEARQVSVVMGDKETGDVKVDLEQVPHKKPRSFWLVFFSLMLGLFLATLDTTVVSTGRFSLIWIGALAELTLPRPGLSSFFRSSHSLRRRNSLPYTLIISGSDDFS